MGPPECWDLLDSRVPKVTEAAEGTGDCKAQGVLLVRGGGQVHRALLGILSSFNKMTLRQLSKRGWMLTEQSDWSRGTAIRTS